MNLKKLQKEGVAAELAKKKQATGLQMKFAGIFRIYKRQPKASAFNNKVRLSFLFLR